MKDLEEMKQDSLRWRTRCRETMQEERGGCIPGCLWQGNFKVQDLNGWKKTSAVRQWMAKENREAEHMLGLNDPKRNNIHTHRKKKRHKWKEHEYTKTMIRASANKQLKQCFLQSSPLCISEEHCFCLLTMSTQNVTRERKKKTTIHYWAWQFKER